MPESASAATDLDLISYLRSIPDARMRRGVRFPSWYLLLVAALGILSGCQSLRDLERFAIRHHAVLTEALDVELRRPIEAVPGYVELDADALEIQPSWLSTIPRGDKRCQKQITAITSLMRPAIAKNSARECR